MGNWEWNNIPIADFHDIHWSSTDIWFFQNRNRSLVSFYFEFAWLETFWNVFRLSSAVVRIMSVLPKISQVLKLGDCSVLSFPMPMDSSVGTTESQQNTGVRGLWLGDERQSTWACGQHIQVWANVQLQINWSFSSTVITDILLYSICLSHCRFASVPLGFEQKTHHLVLS